MEIENLKREFNGGIFYENSGLEFLGGEVLNKIIKNMLNLLVYVGVYSAMGYGNFHMKPESQTQTVLANNHWMMINFHNICDPTLTNG